LEAGGLFLAFLIYNNWRVTIAFMFEKVSILAIFGYCIYTVSHGDHDDKMKQTYVFYCPTIIINMYSELTNYSHSISRCRLSEEVISSTIDPNIVGTLDNVK
jgi:hypothetical protein